MAAKLMTAIFQIIIGWFASQFAGLYADRIPEVASYFPYIAAVWIALTVWAAGLVIAGVTGAITPPGLPHILASIVGALLFAAIAPMIDIESLLPPDTGLQNLLPVLGAVFGYFVVRG